ncbi:MAG: hypothetical protein AB1861_18105 [Cyanobacteriota bacterium]
MTEMLTNLEKLIAEAESRKKFLEQGLKAFQETLSEATAELQSLKASAQFLAEASAGCDPTTQANESQELTKLCQTSNT